MASGTITFGASGNLQGKIEWSSTSNGSSANSSNVTATLYAHRTDSYTTRGQSWSGYVKIGNAQTNINFSSSVSVSSSWVQMATVSTTIGHNSDGSGSVNISGSVKGPSGTALSGNTSSGNQTVALDKIARYGTSNQSLKSKTETSIVMNWSSNATVDYIWYSTNNGSSWTGIDVTDGTSGTYTINGLSANTTYNIKTRIRRKDSQLTTDSSSLSVATYNYPYITKVETTNLTIGNSQKLTLYNPLSRSVTIRMNKDNASGTQLYSGTTTGTSITFTPTASTLYASIPNAQSGNCVYSAIYGSVTKTTSVQKYTINSSNCTPTFTAFTYKDNNSTTSGITGNNQLQIQNKSSLVITASTATAKNSAKITKYTATINGKSYESTTTTINIGTISKSGTLSLVVKAVDSRGLTTSVTKNITVIPYAQPSYTVSVTRKNNYEEETTYKITNGKYDLLAINGANKNTIQTAQYRYKESNGNYNAWKSITLTQNGANYSFSELVGNLDNNKTFIFQTQIIDKLTTVTNEFTLKNGIPVEAIRKKTVGINKVPTIEKGLDIDGDINFTNVTDKIVMPGSSTDNRKLVIGNGNYNFNVSSTSGWGNGIRYRTNDGNTVLGIIGAFGDPNTLNYYYIGQSYDNPVFRVNNTGEAYVKTHIRTGNTCFMGSIFNGASGSRQWVKIGTWYNMGDNDNCCIKVFSGNGYNGNSSQNTMAIIQIKNGWQQTASTSNAFGLTTYILDPNYGNSGLRVKGIATAHNSIDIWLYCPWGYWNGNYIFEGLGSWTPANIHQTNEPSGAAQQISHFTMQPKPISLYYNASGTTGTVTLSDSAANYNAFDIFYIGSGDNDYGSVRLFTPHGKQTALSVSEGGTILRVRATTVKISGTTITPQFGILASVSNGQTGYTENKNYIKIVSVVGWK